MMRKTPYTNYSGIIKAIPTLTAIISGLLFTWFTVYLGLSFEAHVWVFSDNLMVEAFQQLVRVLWLLSVAFSPIWIIYLCVMIYIFIDGYIFRKYLKGIKHSNNKDPH
jgi:hypothetical protein